MKKVVVTDYNYKDLNQEKSILSKYDVDLMDFHCTTEDEVIAAVDGADAVLVQFAPITRRVLESMENCKVVVRYAVGFDNIDLDAATELGIRVVNIPDYCTEEVSEHAVMLLLAVARKLCTLNQATKASDWNFQHMVPVQRLKGRTVGLIGLGRIGRMTARKLQGFNFRVIAYDPYIEASVGQEYGVELVDFDKVISESDFISLHVPLNEETKHMINANVFEKMKQNPFIINTGRGGLIQEDDLMVALESGQIQGAALDVLQEEPIRNGHPLQGLENVILTPHAAWYSEDALQAIQLFAAKEVERMLIGQEPKNIVNQAVLKKEYLRMF
mgnify:CR=1 FL=1